jgi:hypothetical protein
MVSTYAAPAGTMRAACRYQSHLQAGAMQPEMQNAKIV